MDWWLLVTGILFIIAAILGEKYARIKQKIKDVAELLDYLHKALEDNRITKEEGMEIIKRAKKILEDP